MSMVGLAKITPSASTRSKLLRLRVLLHRFDQDLLQLGELLVLARIHVVLILVLLLGQLALPSRSDCSAALR